MANDDDGGSVEMQQQYLGMLIELGATTLSIVGLNIQKWAHMVESHDGQRRGSQHPKVGAHG